MIRYANENDIEIISKYDKHISKEELANIIKLKRVIVMYEDDKFVGWLRYNLFWDNTPFMNMLYLLDNERGKGNGSRLVIFWENEMKQKTTNLFLLQLNQTKKHNFFIEK